MSNVPSPENQEVSALSGSGSSSPLVPGPSGLLPLIHENYSGKSLREIQDELVEGILKQRSEILSAFIAKYGADDPLEVEQVIIHEPGRIRYFIRRKGLRP